MEGVVERMTPMIVGLEWAVGVVKEVAGFTESPRGVGCFGVAGEVRVGVEVVGWCLIGAASS